MDLQLKDRVYLVTGGARGLGRATADALVADGARVVLSGRNAESLDAAVADLGDAAVAVVADNADPGTPARLIDTAREAFGRLDGALVSVGGPPTGTVASTPDEDWEKSFELGVPGCRPDRPRGLRRPPARRVGRLRAVVVGALTHPGPGHLQRPPTRPRDDGQEPLRRAGSSRRPGQRPAARTRGHRAGGRARRLDRRRRGREGQEPCCRSRWVATGSRRSSAGRPRSCSRRRPRSSPASCSRSTAACSALV